MGDGARSGGFKAPDTGLNKSLPNELSEAFMLWLVLTCPNVTIRLTSAGIGSLKLILMRLAIFGSCCVCM